MVFMGAAELSKAEGENACGWCFAKDETVLHHVDSDSFWHKHCFEIASESSNIYRPQQTAENLRR